MGCSTSNENSTSNKIYIIPKVEWKNKNNETMISQTIISVLEENLKRDNYYNGNFHIYSYSHNLDKDTYYFEMFRSLIIGYYKAYEKHSAIEIDPDIIWLLILRGFMLHLKINKDSLTKKIKPFINRKYLTIEDNNKTELKQIEKEEYNEKFLNFSNNLKKNLSSFYNLLDFNFSTTTDIIKIVGYCTMMSEMKTFFDYQSDLYACDYPFIKISGTLNDYEVILRKLEKIGEYNLTWWTDELKPIIINIIDTKKGNINNTFWKKILYTNGKKRQKICGELEKHDLIEGWLLKFFPYDKNNKRRDLKEGMTIFDMINLPPDVSTTTLKFINKEKKEIQLEIMSGFMGMFANEDEEDSVRVFKPEIGWLVIEKTEDSAKSKRINHKKKAIKEDNSRLDSSIQSFGGKIIEKDRSQIFLTLTDNNSSSYDGAETGNKNNNEDSFKSSYNEIYKKKTNEMNNSIKIQQRTSDKTNSNYDKNLNNYDKSTNSINKKDESSISLYINQPKERKEIIKEQKKQKEKEEKEEKENEEEEEEEEEDEEEEDEEDEEEEDEDKSSNTKSIKKKNNNNNIKNNNVYDNSSNDKSSSIINKNNTSNNNKNNNNNNKEDEDFESEEEESEESD